MKYINVIFILLVYLLEQFTLLTIVLNTSKLISYFFPELSHKNTSLLIQLLTIHQFEVTFSILLFHNHFKKNKFNPSYFP